MVCKKCGSKVPENASFCPMCGHTLQEQQGSMSMTQETKRTLMIGGGIVGIIVLIGVSILLFVLKENGDSEIETAQHEAPQTIYTALGEASTTPPTTQEPALSKTPIVTEKPKKENVEPYQTYYVTNCYERIALRKTDSTKAKEICSIPLGAPVSYVGNAKNGFCKVIYDGKTGYALASYLTSDSDKIVSGDKLLTKEGYPTYYVTNCNKGITLRKSSNTSAKAICELPLGAAVSYVEKAENGFYQVIYNGKTGYALASYLTSDLEKVARRKK